MNVVVNIRINLNQRINTSTTRTIALASLGNIILKQFYSKFILEQFNTSTAYLLNYIEIVNYLINDTVFNISIESSTSTITILLINPIEIVSMNSLLLNQYYSVLLSKYY